jgi:two-component system sensor histidine kinase KdpD
MVAVVERAPAVPRPFLRPHASPWQVRAAYVVATLGALAIAAVLLPFRDHVSHTLVAFALLVPVVAASWLGGAGPGIAAAVVSSAAFNAGFLPPYGTFSFERTEYLVAFLAFLTMSVVISWLVGVARERATAAEDREAEVRLLFDLSHVLVSERGEGVTAVLVRVAERLGFVMASVRDTLDEGEGLAFPLRVGDALVGTLVFVGDRPALSAAETRVLRTFADEVALVLQQERLEQELRDAELYRRTDEMRQTLLAAASHELKSPVAAITASVTDLLARDALDPAAVRDVLEDVRTSTGRLEQLIVNLLDLSRIESGALVARDEVVDLDDLIEPALEGVRERWPGVQIAVELADEAASIRGDPVLIERVLTNLVENAARAVRAAPSRDVTVRGSRSDGTVTIMVIDHGPGLQFGDQAMVFTPFYRLHDGSASLGAGLGLAISKGFVTAMGGEIWATDTPGGGATFGFRLPAAA